LLNFTSQSCLPEGIEFTTQAQIDNFQANYSNCTHIEGNVTISGSNITNLKGLSVVTTIEGGIEIADNDALTSLTGLDNIDAGSITHLYIGLNNLLSTCAVQSICEYLVSPNGTVNILDNATGCNSQEEVEAACGVGINDQPLTTEYLKIYPNPSNTAITITITISLPYATPHKNPTLTIFNLNGQQLIQRQITEQQIVVDVMGVSTGGLLCPRGG